MENKINQRRDLFVTHFTSEMTACQDFWYHHHLYINCFDNNSVILLTGDNKMCTLPSKMKNVK